MQVSGSQVFLDHFVHNRPEEPALLLAMLVIAGLEIRIVVVQYLPQGGICWLSRVIDWREGSHKSPFAEATGKVVPTSLGRRIGPPCSSEVELDPVVAALNIKAEVSEWLKGGTSGRTRLGRCMLNP
jgi:hypothetical protein